MRITNQLVYLLPLLHETHAWGSLGHTTVAYVASNFLSPAAVEYFQIQLNDKTDDYLANVATWADSYRYTAAGKFSEPFHFIDAEDSPPTSCGVVLKRDCGGKGCIVEAIGNYTLRLLNETLPFYERMIAAKFLVHFLGDIHQPLHDENLLRGGNGIAVLFDAKPTNLHSIWDTAMPEQLMGSYSLPTAKNWSSILTTEIQHGEYTKEASSWLDNMRLGSMDVIEESALVWARESNAFVCTTVLPEGQQAIVGKELNGTYYDHAIPVIEKQVARAGYRLAGWLNLIAAHGNVALELSQEL